MRLMVVGALVLLSACASNKLALSPPSGVDFSGHWRLNEEESDDPLRLAQGQIDPSKVTIGSGSGPSGPSGQGGQGGGQGGQGRGGRQGGRGGGGGFGGPGGPTGPTMPGMGALGDGLRWPGPELDIKQVVGVVAMTSGGVNQVYQPRSFDKKSGRPRKTPGDGSHGRDMPDRDRGDGPPPNCGWDDRTLVVQGGDPDEDRPPFEQRFSVSEDGERLIEVIGFKGGRSAGFTMSRTWDRVIADSPPPTQSRPPNSQPTH